MKGFHKFAQDYFFYAVSGGTYILAGTVLFMLLCGISWAVLDMARAVKWPLPW